MIRRWIGRLPAIAATLGVAIVAGSAPTSGRQAAAWDGVLDEHPSIQYATPPTTDRVSMLNRALARHERGLARDSQTGYLRAVPDALDVPPASQLPLFPTGG